LGALSRGSIIARATAAEEEQARKARVSFTGDVLWFQMDGKTFITQDKDVMDRLGLRPRSKSNKSGCWSAS
jgi:hypothetical protein